MNEALSFVPNNSDQGEIPRPQPGLEEVPEIVPQDKKIDITTVNETLDKVRRGWTPDDDRKDKKGPTYH